MPSRFLKMETFALWENVDSKWEVTLIIPSNRILLKIQHCPFFVLFVAVPIIVVAAILVVFPPSAKV